VDAATAAKAYSADCCAAMKADANAHFVNADILDLLQHNRQENIYRRMFANQSGNFHLLFSLAVFNFQFQCYFPSVCKP